jgi:hypothetical protein
MKKLYTLILYWILLIIGCKSDYKTTQLDSVSFDTKLVKQPSSLEDTPIKVSKRSPGGKPIFIHGEAEYQLSDMLESGPDSSMKKLDLVPNPEIKRTAQGMVYLTEKQFSGNSVPFVGYVTGNIKSIYVNKKKINFKKDEEFFFRQDIELHVGYNRIPIKIINERDEVTSKFIEINMVEE